MRPKARKSVSRASIILGSALLPIAAFTLIGVMIPVGSTAALWGRGGTLRLDFGTDAHWDPTEVQWIDPPVSRSVLKVGAVPISAEGLTLIILGLVMGRSRPRAGLCLECGYDLFGLDARAAVCPECGVPVGAAVPAPAS